MGSCCGPSASCCSSSAPPEYEYGPAPYVVDRIGTFAGPVPVVSTTLTSADRMGALRVRLNVSRNDYRVRPGLYAVGRPDDTAPVLVTGNYKLTLDHVRRELAGRDAWILILDTRGINVWCAAGKGTFGTAEVVRMVREAKLEQVVSHTRLVLPQLSATGVAAHEVRAQTGFSVVWGPVRATDLPEFLDSGMKATAEMRRVTFPLAERAKLTGVEVSMIWGKEGAIAAAVLAALFLLSLAFAPQLAPAVAVLAAGLLLAVIGGAFLGPTLLPWLPGRAFSAKGAVAGAIVLAPLIAWLFSSVEPTAWVWASAAGLLAAGMALASFLTMNFTGSSTYTSPSGVEREMRFAIPLQIAGAVGGSLAYVVGAVVR